MRLRPTLAERLKRDLDSAETKGLITSGERRGIEIAMGRATKKLDDLQAAKAARESAKGKPAKAPKQP